MQLTAQDRRLFDLRPSGRTAIPSYHHQIRRQWIEFPAAPRDPTGNGLADHEPGLSPKRTGGFDGVDAGILPPGGFIAHAVHQPMMDATERDRELVARLATQGPWLQVA